MFDYCSFANIFQFMIMDENKDQLSATEIDINSDADIPGNTHLSNPDSDDEQEQLNKELQEQKDKYLRLLAEFENYKRRTAKERIELIQTAGKEIVNSLLEVLDDLERAEKMSNSADIEQIKEG